MVVERKKHISINWFERSDALVANLAAAALDFFLVSIALQRLEVKNKATESVLPTTHHLIGIVVGRGAYFNCTQTFLNVSFNVKKDRS